jgi:hypothetical protein
MGYFVQDELCCNLVDDVISDVDDIQESASLALSAALEQHPDITDKILQQLMEVYKGKLKVIEEKKVISAIQTCLLIISSQFHFTKDPAFPPPFSQD